jgi:hypothetical protein
MTHLGLVLQRRLALTHRLRTWRRDDARSRHELLSRVSAELQNYVLFESLGISVVCNHILY